MNIENKIEKGSAGEIRRGKDAGMEALSSSIKAGFVWIYAIMIAMALVILAQSLLIVKQNEAAIISRFGAVRKVVGAGLHLILPYPFERAEIFEITRAKQIESSSFMFAPLKEGQPPPASLNPESDGYLLSSDMNIIHLKCAVNYSIEPENEEAILEYFIRNEQIREIVKSLLDNAILKSASGLSADELLFDQEKTRTKIASEFRKNLAKSAIKIVFEARDISVSTFPPRQTKSSFDALSQVRQNTETLLNEAESYRLRTEREAVGERDSKLALALAEATRKIKSASAEAENFSQRIIQYQKNPSLISRTIFEETMFRISKNVDEKFLIDPKNGRELRLLLGRSLERKKEKRE